jgi:hypothetical protein
MIAGGHRTKGHGGERELCKELAFLLNLKTPLERNVDQVRDGGADIITLRPFAIEVKRQEALHINAWVEQAKSQVTRKNPIPVLFYRQNNRQWHIMLPINVVARKEFRSINDHWVTINMATFITIAKALGC